MKLIARALFSALFFAVHLSPARAVSGYSSIPLGEYKHYPTAVATAGSAVAGYDTIIYTPSVYTPTTGWVDLPDTSGLDTSVYFAGSTTGISQDGQVITGYTVGTSNGTSVQYAVYWNSGQEHIIPAPPSDPAASNMTATAISGDGFSILVEDTTATATHAYVYNVRSRTFTDIGFLDSSVQQTYATGISNDGSVVVGYSSLSGGNSDGFIWTAAAGMQDIGIPDGHPGTFYVHPACVSGDGTRVFGSYTDGGGWMGFYWSRAGGWQFLGFSPTSCTSDGQQAVGVMGLYFPGIWSARRGEGYVANLLTANGIPTTVLSLRTPACISPDGKVIECTGPNPFFDGDETGTVQVGVPYPLVTAPIASAATLYASCNTPLLVPAPGLLSMGSFITGATATVVKKPAHAKEFAFRPDGSFLYIPAVGFVEKSDTFTYKLVNSDGASSTARITIYVTPLVRYLSPNTIAAGSPDFTLTVNGNGFQRGDVVYFGSYSVATTFLSSTQLQVTIPADYVAWPQTVQVSVNDISNAVNFTVQ